MSYPVGLKKHKTRLRSCTSSHQTSGWNNYREMSASLSQVGTYGTSHMAMNADLRYISTYKSDIIIDEGVIKHLLVFSHI